MGFPTRPLRPQTRNPGRSMTVFSAAVTFLTLFIVSNWCTVPSEQYAMDEIQYDISKSPTADTVRNINNIKQSYERFKTIFSVVSISLCALGLFVGAMRFFSAKEMDLKDRLRFAVNITSEDKLSKIGKMMNHRCAHGDHQERRIHLHTNVASAVRVERNTRTHLCAGILVVCLGACKADLYIPATTQVLQTSGEIGLNAIYLEDPLSFVRVCNRTVDTLQSGTAPQLTRASYDATRCPVYHLPFVDYEGYVGHSCLTLDIERNSTCRYLAYRKNSHVSVICYDKATHHLLQQMLFLGSKTGMSEDCGIIKDAWMVELDHNVMLSKFPKIILEKQQCKLFTLTMHTLRGVDLTVMRVNTDEGREGLVALLKTQLVHTAESKDRCCGPFCIISSRKGGQPLPSIMLSKLNSQSDLNIMDWGARYSSQVKGEVGHPDAKLQDDFTEAFEKLSKLAAVSISYEYSEPETKSFVTKSGIFKDDKSKTIVASDAIRKFNRMHGQDVVLSEKMVSLVEDVGNVVLAQSSYLLDSFRVDLERLENKIYGTLQLYTAAQSGFDSLQSERININSLLEDINSRIFEITMRSRDVIEQFKAYNLVASEEYICNVRRQCTEVIRRMIMDDPEVSQLLSTGYDLHPMISTESEMLSIIYQKPKSFSVKVGTVPYKPSIYIQDNCDGKICDCVHHPAMELDHGIALNGTPVFGSIIFEKFTTVKCPKTNLPSNILMKMGKNCLNITIDSVDRFDCNIEVVSTTYHIEESLGVFDIIRPEEYINRTSAFRFNVHDTHLNVLKSQEFIDKMKVNSKNLLMELKQRNDQFQQGVIEGQEVSLDSMNFIMAALIMSTIALAVLVAFAVSGLAWARYLSIRAFLKRGGQLHETVGMSIISLLRKGRMMHRKWVYQSETSEMILMVCTKHSLDYEEGNSILTVGTAAVEIFERLRLKSEVKCDCNSPFVIELYRPTGGSMETGGIYPTEAIEMHKIVKTPSYADRFRPVDIVQEEEITPMVAKPVDFPVGALAAMSIAAHHSQHGQGILSPPKRVRQSPINPSHTR